MAIIYVDSNAAGANDGTSWTDAYTSFASATGAAAGDDVYVDDGHSEAVSADTTYNFSNGTQANPVRIFSVDKSDDSYSIGATISANGAGHDIILEGNIRVYGITFSPSFNFLLRGDEDYLYFEDCTISADADTTAAWRVQLGLNNNLTKIRFVNCTFDFSNSGNNNAEIATSRDLSMVEFIKCTFTPHATQTRLLQATILNTALYIFESCDLSSIPNDLVLVSSATYGIRLILRNCNIPSAWETATSYSGTFGVTGLYEISNSKNGTITDPPLGLVFREDYWGTINSTLSVYRTGGADDGEQSNAYSWKMTSSSNALEIHGALVSPPIAIWTAPDASITAATAQGQFQSTRMAPLGTPAALTTDSSSTWNGTGVGTKQKITVTIGDYTLTVYVASGVTLNNDDFWIEVSAPDQVGGPVTVCCFLAKPSTTVYVDPKLEVA